MACDVWIFRFIRISSLAGLLTAAGMHSNLRKQMENVRWLRMIFLGLPRGGFMYIYSSRISYVRYQSCVLNTMHSGRRDEFNRTKSFTFSCMMSRVFWNILPMWKKREKCFTNHLHLRWNIAECKYDCHTGRLGPLLTISRLLILNIRNKCA